MEGTVPSFSEESLSSDGTHYRTRSSFASIGHHSSNPAPVYGTARAAQACSVHPQRVLW